MELESEPTDDVSVNISVPAGAPFTLNATQLDFTPSNWSNAQTVTVTATDDALDNTGGNRSASISHSLSAADTDYEDETVASVAVTVNDDDAAPMNATLTVDADTGTLGDQDSIGEGAGQTAVEVTVSIDDATRFDTAQTVSITVGKNGDGADEGTDYDDVARFDLTIEAGAASGSKRFNLTPTDDDLDEGDESLSVEGTLAGLTIAADSLTITDDDTAALVLAPTSLTVIEGANGTFTVKLATEPTDEVTVTIGGFTSTDLTLDDTSLTFTTSNWNQTQTVTVSAGHDPDKTNDSATLSLSASGGGYASISANLPVTTSDDEAVVTVGAASAAEGSSVGFTVTLPAAAPAGGTAIDYSTSDGRGISTDASYQVAVAGSDYTAAPNNASITIAQGQSSGTISIATTNDDSYEGDHHFTLTLDAAAGFDISPSAGSATGTITDAADTPSYAFSAAATTLDEDDGTATLRVQRTGDTEVPATLSYATADGTATGGSDFTTLASTNLAFTAAETSKTFTVAITDDSDDEPAEAFSVNLSAVSHAKMGSQASHTVNITDDDATTVTLAAPAGDIAEKNGGKTITVTLGRTLEGDEALAVPLTFGGAATFGDDYALAAPNSAPTGVSYENLTSTNLTTSPPTIKFTGVTSAARAATLTLTAVNDVIDENGSEPVTVGLGTLNASSGTHLGGGASGSGSASFNITDDDSAPGGISLSVDTDSGTSGSQTSLAENAGKTSVTVTASVTGGTAYEDDKTVEIDVGADGSTATEGEDYATVGQLTLTIPAGATTREESFDLTPTDDEVDENDEVIRIAGTSSGITVSNASMTLNDNDEKGVSVSSNSLTIEEVDDGGTPGTEEHKATYTVGLNSQPTGSVRVTLNLPNGAPFTASPAQLDFTSSSWGAQTVTVTAVNDDNNNTGGKRSATITHTLTALNTDYHGLTVGSVAVTVNDDDDAPMSATLSVDADADSNGTQTDLAEGGGAKKVRVTATFGGSTRFDTAQTIAVTVGASTDSATKDTDYSSSANIVNITIAAEGTTGYEDVTLTPTNDDIDEADESISLSGTLSGVTVSGVSIGLIDDDVRGATLSGTSLTVNEADTAATTDTKENEATYTLALTSQPTAAVRVNLSLPDGAPVTISPTHLDFTTSSWGAQTVTVTGRDDAIDNPNNRRDTTITHTLVAGSSDYETVKVPTVSVQVKDDDLAPGGIALSTDISTIAENAATRNVMVTATVGGGTTYSEAKTVEVEVGGSEDSATEGTDYAQVEKFSITINAGAATGQKSFSLNPTDDVIDEPNETIGITGSVTGTGTGSGNGIDVDGASIKITDNDAAPTGVTLSVNPASVAEDAAATSVTVTATVTGGTTYAAAKTVSVAVGDSNDSATEGTDYESVDDFDISIAAGAASVQKAFSLAPTDDARDESNERISVTGTATGITFVDTHIDLIDDEGPPTLSIDSPTVAEGADGTTARLRFNVRLSAASDKQVTVDYADRGTGTAASATDYAAVTAGTLTFAAGDTVKHIDVTVNGDDVDESNETVLLRLSAPSNAGFAGNATTLDATGTITDDDARGLSVSPTTLDIDERDDTSTAAIKEHQGTYAVALTSEPTGGTVTVNVASGATGTATVSPQSLAFNASNWQTAQNVTVTAVDDAYDNTDDARKAIITNTVSAAGTDYSGVTASSVTVTVNDDDTAPMDVALSVDTTTLAEDAGATSITVTATLQGSARFAADKAVRITVGGDTDAAVSGTDYQGVQAFDLTITAGQASGQKSFTLEPTEDVIDEPSEKLSVTGKLAGLAVAPASISITDNDAAPTGIALSVNTTSVSESAAATSVTVTADVQGGTTYGAVTAVSVIVGAAADSAGEGADYARVDEFTIDIPVGAASFSGSFDLAPVNDIIDEPTESISVSGESGDLTVTGAGNIDITDDDATPTASLVLSKTTINENGGSANLSASISGPSSQALTLTISVAVDSPMTTNDFTIAANPVLTIPAGETSSSAKVAVSAVDNDEDHEVDNKQLRLSATASGGLGIADPSDVTLTIKDDDKAGVNFSTSEIEVEKDETTVIQVRLTSRPTMDTTVILTSNNPNVAELSASPRGRSVKLLFTPENWNVPQPVTVHGMDDGEVSIDTTIQSADPMYAKAPVPKPVQTNVIGVPNLTLTASEDHIDEGGAATFTIEADRVSAVDVPVKIEVGYLDCCIGTGEILAEGEQGVRTVTLPQGKTSVSFKVQTADDEVIHGEGTKRGNKPIYAQIVETDAYRIDHTGNDELARFTYYDSVRVGENDLGPSGPADIIVSVSGPERVMEGGTAQFTFTASKAPESDLVISFYLDLFGDFDTSPSYTFDPEVMSGLEKDTATLPAGALETTFSLTIIDDGNTQGHGRMSVRVSNGRNNSYDSADPPGLQVVFDIIDDETSPPGDSEGSQQQEPSDEGASCVSADLLGYVDERIASATTDRWERIKNALTEQANAIGLAQVEEIYENRKANGWTIDRLDEVIEALECLRDQTADAQSAPQEEMPATPVVVEVVAGGDIAEGGDAVFTVSASPAPTADLDVAVTVAETGDFLAPGKAGARTVTLHAGQTAATLTVATRDDAEDEADGGVTATLADGAGYQVGASSSATVAVADDDEPPAAACVSADLLDYVDERIAAATTDRWQRIKNALTGQPNAIGLAQVEEIYQNRKANGWTVNRLDEVIDALECLGTSRSSSKGQEAPVEITSRSSAVPRVALSVPSSTLVEGESLAVTVSLSAALERDLLIPVAVTARTVGGADFEVADVAGTADGAGSARVAIEAGATSGAFNIRTTDDALHERDELIAIALGALPEGLVAASEEALEIVLVDNDEAPSAIVLGVDPGTVPESGEPVRIQVTAAVEGETRFAAERRVRVEIGMAGDAARAGTDYARVAPFVVTIPAGADAGTGEFDFTAAFDHRDEGGEALTVSGQIQDNGPSAVQVVPATLLVADGAALPRADAWLARFGRAVGEQAVEDVGQRLAADRTPGRTGTFGGLNPLRSLFGGRGNAGDDSGRGRRDRTGGASGDAESTPGAGQTNNGGGELAGAKAGLTDAPDDDSASGRGTGARDGFDENGLVRHAGLHGQPGLGFQSNCGGPLPGRAIPGIDTPGGAAPIPMAPATGGGASDTMQGHSGGMQPMMGGVQPGHGAMGAGPGGIASAAGVSGAGMNGATGAMGGDCRIPLTMPTVASLLQGTSFTVTGEQGRHALWGRGSWLDFNGAQDGLTLSGSMASGVMGTDWLVRDGLLAGVMVSHTAARGEQSGGGAALDLSSSLTTVAPYLGYELTDRISLWGLAGVGAGELRVATEDAPTVSSGMGIKLAALGGRGELLGGGSPFGLALKGDALGVWTGADDEGRFPGAAADANRLRLALEGSWGRSLAEGRNLSARLEAGLRHDGGDAEQGFGAEASGGLAYEGSALSLNLEGRRLLAHEAAGFEQFGVSASASWDPSPGTPFGPSLALRRGWGLGTQSGVAALFGGPTGTGYGGMGGSALGGTGLGVGAGYGASSLSSAGYGSSMSGSTAGGMEVELGWGHALFGKRLSAMPKLLFGTSSTERRYGLGWQLSELEWESRTLALDFEVTRRDVLDYFEGTEGGVASGPEYGAKLDFRVTW